jgi:branched-chain amino acid transport system ATP-binding protein
MTELLKIDHLDKSFGGLAAVSNFNLQLDAGAIQGVIGPNGAGKTTVFNLITGVYRPDRGSIRLNGTEISSKSADAIARLGIARTFQNIRLFGEMTALDNIKMSFHHRSGYNFWDTLVRSSHYLNHEAQIRRKSVEYLSYLGLENRILEQAKNLPYGEQRRLEIARALAAEPQVYYWTNPLPE